MPNCLSQMQHTRTTSSCLPNVKKLSKGTVLSKKTVPPITRSSYLPKDIVKFHQQQLADVLSHVKQTVNVNSLNSPNGPTFFAQAEIFSKEIPMLIDSDSQVNVLSVNDCHPDVLPQLATSPINIAGYDGSPINVRGVFKTDIKIGAISIAKTPIFVINEPYKAVLGTPALERLVIDLPRKKLHLNGKVAMLSNVAEKVVIRNIGLQ